MGPTQVQTPLISVPTQNFADAPQDEVLKDVWSKFQMAKRYRALYDHKWTKYFKYYSGQQWDDFVPQFRSRPVVNRTLAAVETILANLTDNRPKIVVLPRTPTDTRVADLLTKLLDYLWDRNRMNVRLTLAVKNMLIVGNGFLKVGWNPDADDGLGELEIYTVDPRHIFVAPYATEIDNADFIIHAQNMSYDSVRRMWPEQTEGLVAGEWIPELTLQRQEGRDEVLVSPIKTTDGREVHMMKTDLQATRQRGNVVTVLELWERMPDKSLRRTIVANNRLIERGPSPFNHDMYPFVHIPCYASTESFWAFGEIQVIEHLQELINKREGQISDILRLNGNPILVVDHEAGVKIDNLVARPGMIIPKNRDGSVTFLQAPSPAGELFNAKDSDTRDFSEILGIVEALQGIRPVGVESGRFFAGLVEQASSRIRLKAKFVEEALSRLGKLLIKGIQQYYSVPRIIRIGVDQMQFIEVASGGASSPTAVTIPPDVEFDVEVKPTSTLPRSRKERLDEYLQFYQLGLFGPPGSPEAVEVVLEAAGVENRDQIVAKIRQMAAQVQAAPQTGLTQT